MNQIINFEVSRVMPSKEAVFLNQGFKKDSAIPEKISQLFSEAKDIFTESSHPILKISELSKLDFVKIYEGEGKNEMDTPLAHIYPQADNLALFALTLGKEISDKIDYLFRTNDFALGFMLDTIASFSADKSVELGEIYYLDNLLKLRLNPNGSEVLGYSPGYCGWHISGQKKLFEVLKPEDINISLNESCLMIPLKSVSGVLIEGDKKIHQFESNYNFCSDCTTYSCKLRMKKIGN